MKTPLISADNVSLGYDGKTVLRDVSFSVDEGQYLAILGENGSGKSTLMKGILGLKTPEAGKIAFDRVRPAEIGYLPQQSTAQKQFPASVWEIVLSGRLSKRGAKPFYGKEDRAIARENLEKLGIAHFAKRSFRELSGGQQQRVLLARALCATTKILLLDEPVSGLDPVATGQMYEAIAKLHKEGLTVIMISHDIGAALNHATQVLHLQGRPLFYGSVEDYRETPEAKRFLTGGQEHVG